MKYIHAPTDLDFYKTFHPKVFIEVGMVEGYTNFTPRSGNYSNIPGNRGVSSVAGLQMFIIKHIRDKWDKFFNAESADEAVYLYEKIVSHGLGAPEKATHLRDLWELGYLPLEIRGLKEGTEAPYGVPHFTFHSTSDGFGWLVGNLETISSCEVYPVHTALTTAREYLRVFIEYAIATGFPVEAVKFQGHDFSMRGMMGVEAAKLTGVGHLMCFIGSDTVPAGIAMHEYYGADISFDNPCTTIASVPATEHSVQCLFNNDEEYIDYCLDNYPSGIFSIVSDGRDFWKLVTEYIPARKEKIMNRDGKLVLRPDTGDPVEILCGVEVQELEGYVNYNGLEDWKVCIAEFLNDQFSDNLDAECPHCTEEDYFQFEDQVYYVTYKPDLNRYDKQYYYIDNCGPAVEKCTFKEVTFTAEQKGLVEYLWDTFGGTRTNKGYKLLDEHIGCIYGDSITLERQSEILRRLKAKSFCSGNVVLGIGSFSYQYVTRDTHGSAVKLTSAVMSDGERRAIFKDPKTGDGTKKSAKGLLFVGKDSEGNYYLEDDVSEEQEQSDENELKLIWKDGIFNTLLTLEEIRETVDSSL